MLTRERGRRPIPPARLAASLLVPILSYPAVAAYASPAPTVALEVQEPRAFGSIIGDRLAQRLTAQVPAGSSEGQSAGGSSTQPRHKDISAAMSAGPMKRPTSPKDSTPPRMPSSAHRNGSFAPSPMIAGRTK